MCAPALRRGAQCGNLEVRLAPRWVHPLSGAVLRTTAPPYAIAGGWDLKLWPPASCSPCAHARQPPLPPCSPPLPQAITKLFPNGANVYARGPVGDNVLHTAMLLNTPSTLAIARYLVKLYGPMLVNCPFQASRRRRRTRLAVPCVCSPRCGWLEGTPPHSFRSHQTPCMLALCPATLDMQERKSPTDPPGAYEGQTALHIAVVNRWGGRHGGGQKRASGTHNTHTHAHTHTHTHTHTQGH